MTPRARRAHAPSAGRLGRPGGPRSRSRCCAADRQHGGQQGQRRRDRQADDDGAGDADRAQDHELEQDEAEQPEQHGQAAEEDRPAGGRDGRCGPPPATAFRAGPVASGQLLAEAARHQQRVVDPEAEPEERREVEHEDAHRRDRGDEEDRRQGHEDAAPPTTSGTPAATTDPKTRSSASAASGREMISLRCRSCSLTRLDIAVERRAAGELDLQVRRLARSRSRRIGSASGESSGGRSRNTMS